MLLVFRVGLINEGMCYWCVELVLLLRVCGGGEACLIIGLWRVVWSSV